MEDEAQKKTEKEVAKVEKQINAVYGQAQKEIEQKINDFNEKFEVKNQGYLEKLNKGEITQEDYNSWYAGQLFQGQQWKAKLDQVCGVLHDANTEAMDIVNGGTISTFAEGANWVAYSMESGEGVNFGFGLYDSKTVTSLIKDNPQILPKWKINEPKEYIWNKQKVNNCVTQGIIQGESLTDIAERIATVTSNQNKNLAMTHAQTALGGAQNAGRIQRLQDAKKMGINVVKQWMATLDDHTRDSHQAMDGEEIEVTENRIAKFSNGCRFPGDPLGPAHEVFNCRCTLVGDVKDYPETYERYDNIDGVPIQGMTYKEWKTAKYGTENRKAEKFVWNKSYSGTEGRQYGEANTADALSEIKKGEHNSLEKYMDENGNLTPERIALHQQIIDNYLSGKIPVEGTATMTMMGGGPASGKSSAIKMGLYEMPNKEQTVTVDPDDIKSYLPGYSEMAKTDETAASFYHEESSMLAKQLASVCFSENYNVTYDGTGDGSVGSVMKKINSAKEYGYEVNGMYVTINIDEALERNQKRYDDAKARGEAPRLVPDDYVIECHEKVTTISMEVSDQFDNICLYDNNGGVGETKLIATGGNGQKLSAVEGEEEAFQQFLDKPNYKSN